MAELEFICPRCRGKLESYEARYECLSCGAIYPIIVGIPDFRVYPDPYIGLEDDRAKGCHLAEKAKSLSYADLVAYYYAITPEVPPDLASRYQAHHLAGLMRGQAMLQRMAAYDLTDGLDMDGHGLDLGCGTGGFLATILARGVQVTGVDIAFRWLVVGRRRLQEIGFEAYTLVCACADYLPFPDDVFNLITAENLIEHIVDVPKLLAETARVRKPEGSFMARTVNRFALAPEPHVGVWGVGFLPQKWMDSYVRFVKGIPYEHIHLQSYGSLRQILQANGHSSLQICHPLMFPADYAHHPASKKRLLAGYARIVQKSSLLRPLLTFFGPYLDIITARKISRLHH